MVGRTPEYLGKKIDAARDEDGLADGAAAAADRCWSEPRSRWSSPSGVKTIFNPGVHGFSEVLYAFSSAGNNNGSAFAGLGANTPWYNGTLGLAMFFARFWLAIPALAIAGSLAAKKRVPAGAGHAADPHPVVRGAADLDRAGGRRAHLHPGAARLDRSCEHLAMIGGTTREPAGASPSAVRPADRAPRGGRGVPQASTRASRSAIRSCSWCWSAAC